MERVRERRQNRSTYALILLVVASAFLLILGVAVLVCGFILDLNSDYDIDYIDSMVDYSQYWVGLLFLVTAFILAGTAIRQRSRTLVVLSLTMLVFCIFVALFALVVEGYDWTRINRERRLKNFWDDEDGYICTSLGDTCFCNQPGQPIKPVSMLMDCESLDDAADIYGGLVCCILLGIFVTLSAIVIILIFIPIRQLKVVEQQRKVKKMVVRRPIRQPQPKVIIREVEKPAAPPKVIIREVPGPAPPPKIIVQKVPGTPPPPKVIVKEVQLPAPPPKVIVKEVPGPPPPPKIVFKEVQLPAPPPRIIVKEVPGPPPPPKIVVKEVQLPPPPPKVIYKEVPGPPPPPKVVVKEVALPPPPPRVIVKEVPGPSPPPRIVYKEVPGPPPPPKVVVKEVQLPPPPPRVVIKEVPGPSPPPRIIYKEVPGPPQPPRVVVKEVQLPPPPPKVIVKEVERPPPSPRVIVKEVERPVPVHIREPRVVVENVIQRIPVKRSHRRKYYDDDWISMRRPVIHNDPIHIQKPRDQSYYASRRSYIRELPDDGIVERRPRAYSDERLYDQRYGARPRIGDPAEDVGQGQGQLDIGNYRSASHWNERPQTPY